MVLGLGWPRGVSMVRKWKWYPPTDYPHDGESHGKVRKWKVKPKLGFMASQLC